MSSRVICFIQRALVMLEGTNSLIQSMPNSFLKNSWIIVMQFSPDS